MKLSPKLRKTGNIFIRIAIVVIVYLYIYFEIFYRRNLSILSDLIKDVFESRLLLTFLISATILMTANLLIEAAKWQYLIARVEKISLYTAVKAVFTGLSVSIFTPNRVGEFLGRVFFLDKTKPIEGIFMTVIGSLSQLLVTLVVGSIALAFFLPIYYPPYDFSTELMMGALYVFGFFANIVFLGLYFNISFITDLSKRIIKPQWKHMQHYIEVFSAYHTSELLRVLLMSLFRYAIFSMQFFLFLKAFGVPISLSEALMVIPVIYIITTAIPTIALSELGVRGSVSIFFIGVFMHGHPLGVADLELRVFAASTAIWLINIALPALVGTAFVFRLRFIKKNSSADNGE